jgi:hypothetical protein
MPLISLREYQEKYFSLESRPHMNTVRAWAKKKLLPIERRGGRIYVQEEKLEKVTNNKLLNRILERE